MASNAELRSVNGSRFCPVCFISCSTKGNLRRHMRKIHADQSPGETANGNSTKFIFLEGDNFDKDQDDEFDEEVTSVQNLILLLFCQQVSIYGGVYRNNIIKEESLLLCGTSLMNFRCRSEEHDSGFAG